MMRQFRNVHQVGQVYLLDLTSNALVAIIS